MLELGHKKVISELILNSFIFLQRQGMFDNNKGVKPTFGISFGLPTQGGGGYPLNPFNHDPLVNPYGSSIGAGGINLGLVSVNPLLSVQVTKDDYGEKVVKPFVNLHVTPNNFLVHKFEDFLSYKKGYLHNSHDHLYYGYPKPPYFHKHHHYHHKPPGHFVHGPPSHIVHGPPGHIVHGSPEYEGPPVHDFYPDHHSGPPQYETYPSGYGDYEGGYDDDYYSRRHLNRTGKQLFNQYQPTNEELNKNYQQVLNNYYNNYLNYKQQDYNNDQGLVNGNNLYNQYQDQYNNGEGLYGANFNTYDNNYNFVSRQGKASTSSNPIKFPNSRKRRAIHDPEKPKRTEKVRCRSPKHKLTKQ